VALLLSRLPGKRLFHDLKYWSLFLFLIFLIKAFFTPGPRIPGLSWLPLSKDGIRIAIITFWRLGLILGYGTLFTAVTRPREVRDVVTWFLKPFPFLPVRRIALMVSLTIHFLPLLIDQANEVRLAFRSRLGNQRKNPLLRAKFIALPLLRRSFIRADELAFALVARGYRDDLPLYVSKIPFSHVVGLITVVVVVLICVTSPY
jgi:energy-coupling factor transporter transmembrane protein EcfT